MKPWEKVTGMVGRAVERAMSSFASGAIVKQEGKDIAALNTSKDYSGASE